MNIGWYLLIFPLIGAIIGWCTNWLAVKMIFRPRKPISILGLHLQGLLPRRRHELAVNVAETVERDLISVEAIQKLIRALVEGDQVRELLHQRIDTLISDQLDNLGPFVSRLVPAELIEKIKLKLEEEVLVFIEGLSEELHHGIAENLDIHDMVRSRIEGFDLERLEEVIGRIAAQELRHIEILGGVLGFVVGVVEVGIVALLPA